MFSKLLAMSGLCLLCISLPAESLKEPPAVSKFFMQSPTDLLSSSSALYSLMAAELPSDELLAGFQSELRDPKLGIHRSDLLLGYRFKGHLLSFSSEMLTDALFRRSRVEMAYGRQLSHSFRLGLAAAFQRSSFGGRTAAHLADLLLGMHFSGLPRFRLGLLFSGLIPEWGSAEGSLRFNTRILLDALVHFSDHFQWLNRARLGIDGSVQGQIVLRYRFLPVLALETSLGIEPFRPGISLAWMADRGVFSIGSVFSHPLPPVIGCSYIHAFRLNRETPGRWEDY